MVLRSEELLGTLTKAAKERQLSGLRDAGSPLVSNDPNGRTKEKLAEVAKTSATMVSRMQRLKRESPDKYSEVVAGDKTISGAYFELPPTRKRKSKRSAVQEEQETTVDQHEVSRFLASAFCSLLPIFLSHLAGKMTALIIRCNYLRLKLAFCFLLCHRAF